MAKSLLLGYENADVVCNACTIIPPYNVITYSKHDFMG